MIRGDNLVVNPSGSLQLNGWTTSGAITVNDGFEMTNGSSMSQLYDAGSPEIPPNSFELSATYRLTQLQSRLTASFGKKLYIVLTYNDGYIDTLVIPLRIDVSIPDHTQGSWLYVKGTIDLNTDEEARELENVQIVVSCESLVGTLIIKDISLITLTDETIATTGDVQDSVDISLEEHLNDITNNHLSDEQKAGLTGGATRLKTIKLGLEDNVQIMNQNLYNNVDPQVTLEVVRKNTPIITPQYWQELLVSTAADVTSTSVAVEKSGNGLGKVYVAYVTNGTLIVKSAQFGYPISEMVWTIEETIPNCSQCALEFDGNFVGQSDGAVKYVTDTVPYLFYTDVARALWYKKIGEAQNPLVGASVTSLDAIRGVASLYKDEDQGLLVFYIISGSVYYTSLISGAWEDQAVVSLAPANAVKIKAERVFDWRIVLQITDSSGALYEVFSKMQASGWNSHEIIELIRAEAYGASYPVTYLNVKSAEEYITLAAGEALCIRYANYSPTIYSAANIATTIEDPENPGQYIDDYGYRIVIEFDQWIPNAAEYPELFKIEGANGAIWYGQSATVSGRFVTVSFNDFNGAGDNPTVRVLSGGLTNGLVAVAESSKAFTAVNLVPPSAPAPVVTGIENTDAKTIIITFDLAIEDIASQSGLNVIGYEPLCSPGGELVETEYVVDSIDNADASYASADIDLSSGDFDGLEVQ